MTFFCFPSFPLSSAVSHLPPLLPLSPSSMFSPPLCLSSLPEGPRGVQTWPVPDPPLRQLPGNERFWRGVQPLWFPSGQRHGGRDDLRLPPAPPERRRPSRHDKRRALRQPGGRRGPRRRPQRRPDPGLCSERQPCLPPPLGRSCHPGWQPSRLQGHRRVRLSQDRWRVGGWRRWSEGLTSSKQLTGGFMFAARLLTTSMLQESFSHGNTEKS